MGIAVNAPVEFLGEFVEELGPPVASGRLSAVYPDVVLEYSEPAVPLADPMHDFVVLFRPEKNLPPLAIRGNGVDVIDQNLAVWVANGPSRTYITVVNGADVIGIFEGKVEAFQTAS